MKTSCKFCKYFIWVVIAVLLFIGYRSCSCDNWYNNGCPVFGSDE